jgi:hypothetical protein
VRSGHGLLVLAIAMPALAIHYVGCTVWDNAVASNGGGGAGGSKTTSSSGPGGSGGGGGAPAVTLLTLADAARLCGMAEECPYLATSLVASLGIPIGRKAGAFVTVTSQSECITWLAGPVPPARVVDIQKRVLGELAKAADCDAAEALLPAQFQKHDMSCTKSACDGTNDAHLCGSQLIPDVVYSCDNELFLGASCETIGVDQKPYCTLGSCNNATTGCQKPDGAIYCDKKTTQRLEGFECGYQGLTCIDGFCGNAGQVTPDSCTGLELGSVKCDGSALAICTGALFVDFDCAGVVPGSTCDSTNDRCKFADAKCEPGGGDGIDACDASAENLVVCLAGVRTTIACPSHSCPGDHCIP